jgi:hypothetical protein
VAAVGAQGGEDGEGDQQAERARVQQERFEVIPRRHCAERAEEAAEILAADLAIEEPIATPEETCEVPTRGDGEGEDDGRGSRELPDVGYLPFGDEEDEDREAGKKRADGTLGEDGEAERNREDQASLRAERPVMRATVRMGSRVVLSFPKCLKMEMRGRGSEMMGEVPPHERKEREGFEEAQGHVDAADACVLDVLIGRDKDEPGEDSGVGAEERIREGDR